MILPDVNLPVYAVDETSGYHHAARDWWDETLSSSLRVGLCYPTILGFVRLVTHRKVFANPMSVSDALACVRGWLAQPNTTLVVPTPGHWPLLERLLEATGVGANLTTDAHIAALAIEHGYAVYSNDGDFARFPGLRWVNPLS